jgi:hypothetical protein
MLRPYVEYIHVKDALMATGQIVPVGEEDGEFLETLRAKLRLIRRLITSCACSPAFTSHIKLLSGASPLTCSFVRQVG